jgi:hypothetical protein
MDGILNFEKKGKMEKKGLYNMGKKDPNPVIRAKAVVTQKTISTLSGVFSSAPNMAKMMATNPR